MAELELWEHDHTLYLFTSLTAGSSHIVTATSRIETILRANRIPFSYIDTGTNETAKKLFQRRGRGKKLPLLVKEGFVLADLEQVEEWNEFGELKENIGDVTTTSRSIITTPAKIGAPSIPAPADATPVAAKEENVAPSAPKEQQAAQNPIMRQLAEQAAAKAKSSTAPISTTAPAKESPPASAAETAPVAAVAASTSPSAVPLPASPNMPKSSAGLEETGEEPDAPANVPDDSAEQATKPESPGLAHTEPSSTLTDVSAGESAHSEVQQAGSARSSDENAARGAGKTKAVEDGGVGSDKEVEPAKASPEVTKVDGGDKAKDDAVIREVEDTRPSDDLSKTLEEAMKATRVT